MDFPRFRLLGTRLRTALVRLRLTHVLLFLLLVLFGWHEWANRTPVRRYVKWSHVGDQVAILDTSTGAVYVRDVANAWAAILQPPGWTPEKTEKLRPLLSNDENA